MQRHARTKKLIGEAALATLEGSHVAVIGVGGVGGYIAEALARSGVGKITLVDKDVVDITNLNRQIIALDSTVGQSKTEVMKKRIADINPRIEVHAIDAFITSDNVDTLDFDSFSYIADAVDFMEAKLALVEKSYRHGVPIICAMGAGNKLDPTRIKIAGIDKTSVCPLARVMRREAKKRGLTDFKVAYSDELPTINEAGAPASYVCVPAAMGLAIAAEIIKDLISKQ